MGYSIMFHNNANPVLVEVNLWVTKTSRWRMTTKGSRLRMILC